MRTKGLVSVAPRSSTSRPAPGHTLYPYRLRGLPIERPDQVGCAGITSIRLAHGFVYLTAVMDWYSRYVLAWEVSVTLGRRVLCQCAGERLTAPWAPADRQHRPPGQFTGQRFTDVLKAAQMDISLAGKGRALDNIMVERLWRSVKYEEVYLKDC